MKNLRIYDIVTEDGKSLADIQALLMPEDFDWVDVFNELEKIISEPIESYSYEVVE